MTPNKRAKWAAAPLVGLMLWALPVVATAAGAVATPFNYTRTSSFTYYGPADGALNGLLKYETLEPGNADDCLQTLNAYDLWGNKTSRTLLSCTGASAEIAIAQRTATQTWSRATLPTFTLPDGRVLTLQAGQFPLDSKNALGQPGSQLFDPRFGTPTQVSDANGQTTTAQYDELGRQVRQTKPDGTGVSWRHCVLPAKGLDTSTNSEGCATVAGIEAPADAVFYTQSWPTDTAGAISGAWVMVFTDRLGRQLRTVTQSFDGAWQPATQRGTNVAQDDVYDAYGTKVLSSQPYWLNTGSSTTAGRDNAGATRALVDALGRPRQVYTVDNTGTRTAVFGASSFGGYGAYGSRPASLVEIAYAGNKTTTTTYYKETANGAEKSRQRVEEKNPIGEVVRVTDATGAQVVHQADAFGLLRYTKDALGNVITVDSNVRGQKVKLYDADTGTMEYGYNAVGELVRQSNAKQRTKSPQTSTRLAYDPLGRLRSRTDDEYVSTWYYDKDAAGASCRSSGTSIGQLCEAATTHGVRRRYGYDGVGRPTSERLDVANGLSAAQGWAWDGKTGRLAKRTWPTGLAVSYDYTPLGAVAVVRLAQAATINALPTTPGGPAGGPVGWPAGKVIWRSGSVNAWGGVEQQSTGEAGAATEVTTTTVFDAVKGRLLDRRAEHLGTGVALMTQGYSYDTLGRLSGRSDRNASLSETFTHDRLDRLVNYTAASPGISGLIREVDLTYNAIGQLLKRSDLGAYAYTVVAGQTSAQPHAIKKFTDLSGKVTKYGYDANGNMTSTSVDGTCQGKYCGVAYNSFNQPDSELGLRGPVVGTAGSPRYTWHYDQDHARIKETRLISGSGADAGTRTTWRLHPDHQGGLGFEYEDDAPKVASAAYPKTQQSRHYISAGGQVLGVFVTEGPLPTLAASDKLPPTKTSLSLRKVEFWHVDGQGTLVATSNHAGAVTQRYSYDPFGQRRFNSGGADPGQTLEYDWNPAVSQGTGNGYTGHEHLDDVGLIHMNGRLYDGRLGLFLQPDPSLQDPLNLQNFHRYGYCLGGPLNCTDPSGYNWLSDRWQAAWHSQTFRVVASVAAAYFLGPGGYGMFTTATAGAYAGIANAAVAGFASGAIASGNLKGAVQGAFTAAVFYGVGNVNEGGDFFTGGGKAGTYAFGKEGSVVLHGVAGCVTSAAGGGKCEQGALSAAFSKYATVSGITPNNFAGGLAVSAAIGGTASVLGGGKFANGAKTAAYGYLFNHLMHENTPAANGLHRRTVVRDDQGNALFGFSFGMNDDANPFTENFSKGSSSGVPAPGKAGNGEVYIDMNDPTTKTVQVFRTTPAEDRLIVDYMKTRIGDTASYNALTNSCRDFSAAEFDKIKTEIIRARAENRPPKF